MNLRFLKMSLTAMGACGFFGGTSNSILHSCHCLPGSTESVIPTLANEVDPVSPTMKAIDELKPGSPAPPLKIREWFKGEPIEELDPKAIYVVEFWATWCGPCIESIPHLSELAKKHTDIVFLGVGVLEDSTDGHIKSFVDDMGEKMAYRVAYAGNRDGMAATWLAPAFQDGIPTAFVVKNGLIQWIGHPDELDLVLEQVKAESFDLEAHQKAFAAQVEKTKVRMAAEAALQAVVALREKGSKEDAQKALEQAVATYPKLATSSERLLYEWLAEDNPEAWLIETKKLADTRESENLQKIVSFALRSAQKPTGTNLARSAIAIALTASAHEDWDVLLYARTIYLKLADDHDALKVTNRLLELLPNSPAKDNEQMKEAFLKSRGELEAKIKAKQRD